MSFLSQLQRAVPVASAAPFPALIGALKQTEAIMKQAEAVVKQSEAVRAAFPSPTSQSAAAGATQLVGSPSSVGITKLVVLGNSSGDEEYTLEQIDDMIAQKLKALTQRVARDPTKLPSVLSDLVALTGISETHYLKRKEEVFDLLMQLLERDPINQETATGVLDLITALHKALDSAHRHNVRFQIKLARAFGAAVELYLRHFREGALVGAIPDDFIKQFKASQESFTKLNAHSSKSTELKFALEIARQGIIRLTSDKTKFDEMCNRLGNVAKAIQSVHQRDLKGFFTNMLEVFKGIQNFPKEWFEALYSLRSGVRSKKNAMEKMEIIRAMLEVKKKDFGWKFIYGALETVEGVVSAGEKTPAALEKALSIIDGFVGFNGFGKEDNRKIQSKAQELQKSFSAELAKLRKPALPNPVINPNNAPPPLPPIPVELLQAFPILLTPIPPPPKPVIVTKMPLNRKVYITKKTNTIFLSCGCRVQPGELKREEPAKVADIKKPAILPSVDTIFREVRHGQIQMETLEKLAAQPGDLINTLRNKHGSTLLIVAARYGHLTICRNLLKLKAVPTLRGYGSRHALHSAVLSGHIGIVQLFVELFAKNDGFQALFDAKDFRGRTPLMLSTIYSPLEIFELLYPLSDSFAVDLEGRNAFHLSAQYGRVDIVRIYVAKYDVNQADQLGCTPLHLANASNQGGEEITKILLKAGADPRKRDRFGWNVLHIAVACSRVGIVQLLVNTRFKDELIHDFVIYTDEVKLAQLFIKSRLKQILQDGKIDYTTWLKIFFTIEEPYESLRIGKWLVHHYHIMNPLTLAIYSLYPQRMCEILLEAGASPLLGNHLGINALHEAVTASKVEVAQLILQSPFKADLVSRSLKYKACGYLQRQFKFSTHQIKLPFQDPRFIIGQVVLLRKFQISCQIIPPVVKHTSLANLEDPNLMSAAVRCDRPLEMCQLLLKEGAGGDLQAFHMGKHVLNMAILKSQVEVVQLLLNSELCFPTVAEFFKERHLLDALNDAINLVIRNRKNIEIIKPKFLQIIKLLVENLKFANFKIYSNRLVTTNYEIDPGSDLYVKILLMIVAGKNLNDLAQLKEDPKDSSDAFGILYSRFSSSSKESNIYRGPLG